MIDARLNDRIADCVALLALAAARSRAAGLHLHFHDPALTLACIDGCARSAVGVGSRCNLVSIARSIHVLEQHSPRSSGCGRRDGLRCLLGRRRRALLWRGLRRQQRHDPRKNRLRQTNRMANQRETDEMRSSIHLKRTLCRVQELSRAALSHGPATPSRCACWLEPRSADDVAACPDTPECPCRPEH